MPTKITPAKMLKLIKDLHDASYYKTKGISVEAELATLKSAFGTLDLQGYRQALNDIFKTWTEKQNINFKKKFRAHYNIGLGEYINRIRKNLGELEVAPQPALSLTSPSPSVRAPSVRPPTPSPSVRARSIRPPTPPSRPPSQPRPKKKPLAPPPIGPIPEFLLKKKPQRKRRAADIYVPPSPSLPVFHIPSSPPKAPRLGPTAAPFYVTPRKAPYAPRLAPMDNVSPSPFMMPSNKPSVSPFSFNSPDKKQRVLTVGSPQRSFHMSDYSGSPHQSGIGDLPYSIKSSPWTPIRSPSAPADPFHTSPSAPPLINQWKRQPLLMGSQESVNKRRSWKGKKPPAPNFG